MVDEAMKKGQFKALLLLFIHIVSQSVLLRMNEKFWEKKMIIPYKKKFYRFLSLLLVGAQQDTCMSCRSLKWINLGRSIVTLEFLSLPHHERNTPSDFSISHDNEYVMNLNHHQQHNHFLTPLTMKDSFFFIRIHP